MTATFDQIVAAQRAERERKLDETRKQAILFTLESVDTDGFPRVSMYTVEHLAGRGLIEKVPGDKLGRFRLTPEGRIMLHANPAELPASDKLALFGTV